MFRVISQFDALAPETLKVAMQRPEFRAPHGVVYSWSAITGIVRMLFRVQSALWRQDLTGIVQRVDELIAQHTRDVEAQIKEAKTGKARIHAIIDILQTVYQVALNWVPQFGAGEIAKHLLVRVGRVWSDEIDLDALSLGLPGNVVTEMNLKVGDLADIARQSPELCALFKNLGDDGQALAQASQIEEGASFMDAWDTFIEAYGARGPSEIDILAPRWYEEPLPLLQVIASYLEQDAGSHRDQHQKLVDEREQAIEQLRQ